MDRGKDKHFLSLLALNPLAIESMELFSGLLAPQTNQDNVLAVDVE